MSMERILSELGPVFDSHEHFGYHGEFSPGKPAMSLKDVINGAYMSTGSVGPTDYVGICEALARNIGSDRFQSFRLGLKKIYGDDIYPLSPRVVEALDVKVREAYQNGDHTYRVLKELMHVDRAVLDVPPRVWDAWKHSLLGTTIRLDETACPFIHDYASGDYYVSTLLETQVGQFAAEKGMDLVTLDDFDEVLEEYVTSHRRDAVAIKIGTAYKRGIDYAIEENRDGVIGEIYKKYQTKKVRLTRVEMERWSNYVTTFLLSYAMAEQLPVQVHTGLATMEETSPLKMVPIMKSFPTVQFFLFHGGYPFYHVLPGVLDICRNAHADLCWMPILSQHATKDLLTELIAMGHADRVIAFGGDCIVPEGSLGALIVLKGILASVLDNMVSKSMVNHADAVDIGNRLLGGNGMRLFPFKR